MKRLKYLITFFILCSLSYILFSPPFENKNTKHKTKEENLSQYYEKADIKKDKFSDNLSIIEEVENTNFEETDKPINNSQDNVQLEESKETAEEIPTVNTLNVPLAENGEMFHLINEARLENGLNQLNYDPTLYSVADIRLNEISTFFSHTRPDGSEFYTVSSALDGENLSKYGAGDANSSFNGFMNSQGHRENILYSGFTRVACKKAVINGVVYWIQLFGY